MLLQVFDAAVATAIAESDRRIVITGAGGWLGLATLELLSGALGDALGGRVRCYGSSVRQLHLRSGVSVEQRPLSELPLLDNRPTLVLHFAFLTKDRVDGMNEDAYRAANRGLSAIVLDSLDAIGATAVFVASSGAARSADDAGASQAMRLYGSLKLQDEVDFASWARCSGRTAVITRIFNVAGPYINKHDAYALAAFILDALAGRPINVRAPHKVVRGFVAIRDLMSLIFALLLAEDGSITAFDTGGEPYELAELAAVVAEAVEPVAVQRAEITSERIDYYVGDGAIYRDLLNRHGIEPTPLRAEIRAVADFLIASD